MARAFFPDRRTVRAAACAAALALACSGSSESSEAAGSTGPTGTWNGTYQDARGHSYPFTAHITQIGAALTGTLVDAPGVEDACLVGAVEGSSIVFQDSDGYVTLVGTVSGGSAAGEYVSSGLGSISGTWQATRGTALPSHLLVAAPDFGAAFVGSTVERTVAVTNVGRGASGVLTMYLWGPGSEFSVVPPAAGECTSGETVLPAGGGCTFRVRWNPGVRGTRSATIAIGATPAPGACARATASGLAAGRISVAVEGTGTVTSVPAGIDCGTICEGTFSGDVTLQARTTPGEHLFAGWTGLCAGAGRDCAVPLTDNGATTASFSPVTHNLVFVSSVEVPMNLGGVAAYDAKCNELAAAAGINNAAENAYVAWLSSSGGSVTARMGGARGFVRTDGAPVADFVSDLVDVAGTGNRILHAISVDENGADVGNRWVATGTLRDGASTLEDCDGYSSTSAALSFGLGHSKGGPTFFTQSGQVDCSRTARLYCFMTTKTEPLVPTVASGKRIWVTSAPYAPGVVETPDAWCDTDKPGDVLVAKALVATTTTPAAAALDPAQTYVRPDGQIVGTYAQLVAAGDLPSGPWQQADGKYRAFEVWTGYDGALTNVAAAGSTCLDWTSASAGIGRGGLAAFASPAWWAAVDNASCTVGRHLICVEQ